MPVLEPAINTASVEEMLARLRLVRGLVDWVQIDVSDGEFAHPQTVHAPSVVVRELSEIQVHVHLMVQDVPHYLDAWMPVRPKRITIHIEAEPRPQRAFAKLREQGIERGLALGPSTSVDRVFPFLDEIDFLLFVSVPPGRSGQSFDPTTLLRLRTVHTLRPQLRIGVDGGITPDLVRPLLDAGATSLSVGSGIFSSPDPRAALGTYSEAMRIATRNYAGT